MKEKFSIKRISIFSEKTFILITCLISFLLGLLYLYKGLKDGLNLNSWIVIILDFLCIPVVLFFKQKGFTYFYLGYALILVFITAFTKTYLYNNFTCLFMLFVVIMVAPKLRVIVLVLYFVAVTIAYILNEEQFYLYMIHITRASWFYYIFLYEIEKKYKQKKLILYDDEIKILTQLSKNYLQKSIQFEGYSESTIYRRLKAAMNRNNLSKQDLIEKFKQEYKELLK